MNWDKVITLVAIVGVISITILAMFLYNGEGREITSQAITGLLGFAGGGAVGYAIAKNKKDGE